MTEVIELPEVRQFPGRHGHSSWSSYSERRGAVTELDHIRVQQGGAFIEDAANERLTYHKCDVQFLRIYRRHGGWICQLFIAFVIMILHLLVFFEEPSSLSVTADVRSPNHHSIVVPYPTVIIIEGVCLLLLSLDCGVKVFGYGVKHLRSYRWHLLYCVVLGLSFAGWVITLCFQDLSCGIWCKFRCFLRPLILLQHSSLMKKAFLCLVKAIPSIFSVYLLFFIHIVFFTLVGLVILPYDKGPAQAGPSGQYRLHFGGGSVDGLMNMLILLTTANSPDIMTRAYNENRFYAIFFIIYVAIGVHFLLHILFAIIFQKFREHFRQSMRHTILRRKAGLIAAFEVLSDYGEHNMEKHVPVKRLKDVVQSLWLKSELKEDIFNRIQAIEEQSLPITWRVFHHDIFIGIVFQRKKKQRDNIETGTSANFDPLNKHRLIVELTKDDIKSFKESKATGLGALFRHIVLYLRLVFGHPWFVHFGSIVTLANVFFILSQSNTRHVQFLEKETSFFILYYALEQIAIAWAIRPRAYLSHTLHRLDLLTIVPLALSAIFFAIVHQAMVLQPNDEEVALLVLGGSIHILIAFRMLRVVMSMKLPNLIFRTTADLIVNLTPFLGLLAALYYIFAVLGMIIFANKISYDPEMEGCWRWEGDSSVLGNSTKSGTVCPYGGGYSQRDYWAENFDDFASSIVLLWNLMLVNNWDIIVKAFSSATSPAAQLYFVAWYIVSVAMTLSLLTAVIVENFLMRWSIFARHERTRKHLRLAQKVAAEAVAARERAERLARGTVQEQEYISKWQRARRLRQRRADALAPGSSVGATNNNSLTNSVTRPTQSQPLSLIQVLDVKMPSLEEVRQHLALSPYSPTAFALNIVAFSKTYDHSNRAPSVLIE